jgi:hypothetical protein
VVALCILLGHKKWSSQVTRHTPDRDAVTTILGDAAVLTCHVWPPSPLIFFRHTHGRPDKIVVPSNMPPLPATVYVLRRWSIQGGAVGRSQRPLDPTAGIVAELRTLREQARTPTYLQIARRTGRSRTASTEATGGDHLPTWEPVAAFVTTCHW